VECGTAVNSSGRSHIRFLGKRIVSEEYAPEQLFPLHYINGKLEEKDLASSILSELKVYRFISK
jgi:hypothetical protein